MMRGNSAVAGTVRLAIVACGLAGCSMLGIGGSKAPMADAILRDANGAEVARATLRQNADNTVTVIVSTTNVANGTHGLHFHAVGSCVAPAFTSAGGHFNPTSHMHGLKNPAGPHSGDLDNLVVSGNGRFQTTTNRVTLTAGASSLLDADGSALVIHATVDDQMTDPSGNSGARIACGVITAR